MTPNEFIATLKRLDLPLYRAAKLLGVNARTVRRWTQDPTEAGARKVPGPAAVFLRFLIAQGTSGDEALAILGIKNVGPGRPKGSSRPHAP